MPVSLSPPLPTSLPPSIKLINHPCPIMIIENEFASARLSLLGAHLLSFIPKKDKRERLWLSANAVFDGSKSIRGGIPICWPWFGNHAEEGFPAHGFVRTQQWTHCHVEDKEDFTEIILQPETCLGTGFNGSASLRLRIRIGHELNISLITTNTGSTSFTFTCALHSYFSVNNISTTELIGLSGSYLDKPNNYASFTTPAPYHFSNETDRIHLNPVPDVTIKNVMTQTQVLSTGHDSIVVWNPWHKNSIAMTDMEENGYRKMVCVETSITQGLQLEPDEEHTLKQAIR